MHTVTETRTPDQAELQARQAELKSLEKELSEQELQWTTLQHRVRLFESAYQNIVTPRLTALDALKAQILELAARLEPESTTRQAEAQAARARTGAGPAPSIEAETEAASEATTSPRFEPEDSLKKLFREAAKRFHPDLSTEGHESARRHTWMARLNQAYGELDADKIRDLIDEWEAGEVPKDPATLRSKLARVLKQIGQVRHRLYQIQKNLEQLRQTDMARLMDYAQQAKTQGRDVLQDLADEMQEKMDQLKTRVSLLASDCSLI